MRLAGRARILLCSCGFLSSSLLPTQSVCRGRDFKAATWNPRRSSLGETLHWGGGWDKVQPPKIPANRGGEKNSFPWLVDTEPGLWHMGVGAVNICVLGVLRPGCESVCKDWSAGTEFENQVLESQTWRNVQCMVCWGARWVVFTVPLLAVHYQRTLPICLAAQTTNHCMQIWKGC